MTKISRSFFGKWFVIILATGGLITACGGDHHKGHHVSKWIAFKLDFDDQQKQLLSEIETEFRQVHATHNEQRSQNLAELSELIQQESLDTAKVTDLVNKFQEQRADHVTLMLPKVAELHAGLSPKQKEKILKRIAKWGDDD